MAKCLRNPCSIEDLDLKVNPCQLIMQEPEDVIQIKRQVSSLISQLQRMGRSDPEFNVIIYQINSLSDSIPMRWRDYPD